METRTRIGSTDRNIKANDIRKGKWFSITYKEFDSISSLQSTSNGFLELVIISNTEYQYERALRLIIACLYLTDGVTPVNLEEYLPSWKRLYQSLIALDEQEHFIIMEIDKAVQIALKASFSLTMQNAIYKYKIGCSIHSNSPLRLGSQEEHITHEEYFIDDQIRYANAIVVMYSVIEELGFAIDLPKGKRTITNGKWDKDILEELQNRLINGNIDIDSPIVWIKRFKPTLIEKKRDVIIEHKAEWAHGPIRDCYIKIVDAIDSVRKIRNKIAAHNLKREYRSLTVYDVENASFLAKRLICEKLGFW
jgi:hypothetical protein